MKKNILIITLLLLYTIVFQFGLDTNLLKYIESINAGYIILLTFLCILLFGLLKTRKTYLERQVNNKMLIVLIVYFTLYYATGAIFGYLANGYSLKILSIIDNTLSPIIVIVGIELIRYILVKANKANKKMIYLITTAIILFEIGINVKFTSLNSIEIIFKAITATAIPVIIKNIVLSYLVSEFDYKTTLIYRLIMDMYIFIIPIIPNVGDYITSIFGICLPIIIYIMATRMINEYNDGVKHEFNKQVFRKSDLIGILSIIILAGLVSGLFPLYITGIGSQSMTPKINKGDAVLVKKVNNEKQIKKGDVIAFKYDKEIRIHRIVKIKKIKGTTYYRTKGDANNTDDDILLTMKNIRGKIIMKIPYIGYPSVALKEIMEKQWKR